jgi:hypothetical protein
MLGANGGILTTILEVMGPETIDGDRAHVYFI